MNSKQHSNDDIDMLDPRLLPPELADFQRRFPNEAQCLFEATVEALMLAKALKESAEDRFLAAVDFLKRLIYRAEGAALVRLLIKADEDQTDDLLSVCVPPTVLKRRVAILQAI